jgi:hypothetical protein
MTAPLDKYCVGDRSDGQILCPNIDSFFVGRRRKSLIFNERRDRIYVRHQETRDYIPQERFEQPGWQHSARAQEHRSFQPARTGKRWGIFEVDGI